MAYIGKIPGGTALTSRTLDSMTGDGSDTTLTLSQTPDSVIDVAIYYDGIMQRPGIEYTLAGNTITFTTAPANGVFICALTGGAENIASPMVDSVTTDKLVDGVVTNAKITSVASSKLTGAFPALDGSALTNITSPWTTSTNDPTISTNPSGGVGSIWVNKTSGEMYVCTNATAGKNAWANVGSGDGGVQPYVFQGTIAGFASGGIPTATTINKYSFTSDGNATTHGNLTSRGNMRFATGVSSKTHGYTVGGGTSNVIDKFAFAGSGVTATDVGDMTASTFDRTMTSSTETHGYAAGGEAPSVHTNIDKFAYASDGNAVDSGSDLSVARHSGTGHTSDTHGYAAMGNPNNATRLNTIDKYAFASSGTASDVGDLTAARDSGAGSSSSTYGYAAGGYDGSTNFNTVDRFAFASDGNATDWTDLTRGSRHLAGSSSTTHGYAAGGLSSVDVIDKWSHVSNAIGTDVGNLVAGKDGMAGNHN